MTSPVDTLHEHVLGTLGAEVQQWPGGWPHEIEAALIDAVFSVRAKYGSRVPGHETGVFGAVQRWRASRQGAEDGSGADDLRVLAATDAIELRRLTNNGKLSGRYKAEVVIDAARALTDAGIASSKDFTRERDAARSAYLSVRGCGPVTWRYLRMRLGEADVKPDTWVMRFIDAARVGTNDRDEAATLITQVAKRMDVKAQSLDHAIWRYQRNAPSKPPN